MTDEAKKVVDALRCDFWNCGKCDYEENGGGCDSDRLNTDAADQIERLSAELERVSLERDAAVRDLAINRSCATCKNEAGLKCAANGCAYDNEWQWRGVCEENTEAQYD